METIPVTLIVKASNQQFEDQTIKCELSWTIRKLKGYLTEVYPCKPSTDEQKLIYSGQLLNDTVILKDILRQYDGQETHTVHLVFTPKHNQYFSSKKMSAKTNNTSSSSTSSTTTSTSNRVDDTTIGSDGLRQRQVAASATPTTAATPAANLQDNIPANVFYNSATAVPPAANSAEYAMAQHLAMQNWMQQTYMLYYNQYVNVISNGQASPESLYATANAIQPAAATTNMMNNPNLQHLVQSLPNVAYYPYLSSLNSQIPTATNIPTPTPPSIPAPTSQPQVQNPVPNQANGAAAVVEPAEVAPQNDNPQQAHRRFPNIVEQEQENRDWLDIFFSLGRIGILLTVVYLYSSPIRCLIVIIIGISLYLYQIGFFRNDNVDRIEQARRIIFQQINNQNANNNNNNNNINVPNEAAAAPPPQPPPPVEVPETRAAVIAEVVEETPIADDENANQDNQENEVNSEVLATESTPILTEVEANRANINDIAAFIRTLVFSFFTSIIPDTPAS